jgi:hypothetical protein
MRFMRLRSLMLLQFDILYVKAASVDYKILAIAILRKKLAKTFLLLMPALMRNLDFRSFSNCGIKVSRDELLQMLASFIISDDNELKEVRFLRRLG